MYRLANKCSGRKLLPWKKIRNWSRGPQHYYDPRKVMATPLVFIHDLLLFDRFLQVYYSRLLLEGFQTLRHPLTDSDIARSIMCFIRHAIIHGNPAMHTNSSVLGPFIKVREMQAKRVCVLFRNRLTHVILDILTLVLPVIQIGKLRLRYGQKIAVIGLFTFGILWVSRKYSMT